MKERNIIKKPPILVCSELTSILESNIEKIEKCSYKIKDDEILREPIFLYSYAMFEGAIAMLMTKFCNAFPEKIPKELFSGIEKDDLIYNTCNREAIDSIVEKFIIKVTYNNVEQWVKQLEKILGININYNSEILTEISETRNCLTHNNRNY